MAAGVIFVFRELLMVLVLSGLGAGFVSFLPRSLPAGFRFGLLPVMGLCFGASVYTTIDWFFSANDSYWTLPCFVLASVGVAAVRAHRSLRSQPLRIGAARSALRTLIGFFVVFVVVTGPVTATMVQHDSIGPAVFGVSDVDGYVAQIDETIVAPIRYQETTEAHHLVGPWRDFIAERADYVAYGPQELDQTAFAADLDSLIELHAIDTWEPFLIAILFTGALGALAAATYLLRAIRWEGVLAGCLFGGAFFLQLVFDTSEGAICGVATLLPIIVISDLACRRRRPIDAILLGVLVGGLAELYPIYLVPLAGTVGCLLLWTVIKRRHTLESLRHDSADFAKLGFTVVATGFVVDWDGVRRAASYLKSLFHSGFILPGLPKYSFPGMSIVSFVLQGRGLYALGTSGTPASIWFDVVFPAVAIAAIVVAMVKFRMLRVLMPVTLVSAVLAVYEQVRNACSYCEERNLIPLVPIIAFAVALGLGAIVREASRRRKALGLGSLAVVVGSTAYTAAAQGSTYASDGYFLSSQLRTVVSALKGSSGAIELEGFDDGPHAPAEQLLSYDLLDEEYPGRVSVPADFSENAAFDYATPGVPLPGPQFDGSYRYVVTRMGAVATSRTVVLNDGGVALERRSDREDVTVDYGFIAPEVQADPTGAAWAWQSGTPMQFLVTGAKKPGTWVGLQFDLPPNPVTITPQATQKVSVSGGVMTVCLRASGPVDLQVARVTLHWTFQPRLVAMEALTADCPYPQPANG